MILIDNLVRSLQRRTGCYTARMDNWESYRTGRRASKAFVTELLNQRNAP